MISRSSRNRDSNSLCTLGYSVEDRAKGQVLKLPDSKHDYELTQEKQCDGILNSEGH